MAENSKIEWTDHTFNPWVGCQKVSPACDHCYAEGWAKRSGLVEWGPHAERRRTTPAAWRKPLTWNLRAGLAGVRERVFCASLADVFDNRVPAEWRADLWTLIAQTPHLDWLLLTKRPGNIADMLPPSWGEGWHNVWLGCTVVNQDEADRDVPKLLDVPARVRFLSMEPLLGPVDLTAVKHLTWREVDALSGYLGTGMYGGYGPRLDWIIVGGESGPGARPMHPAWVRSLRDQCQEEGTAFFLKQWGAWAPVDMSLEGGGEVTPDIYDGPIYGPHEVGARVGKARAGRLLDGRTWDQMPGGAG